MNCGDEGDINIYSTIKFLRHRKLTLHMQVAEDVKKVKMETNIMLFAHTFIHILMLCTTCRYGQGKHGERMQQQEAT